MMMVNKGFKLPPRTFSPARAFIGDRGILLDSLERVLRSDSISAEEKIVAPMPWKACLSPPVAPRPSSWREEDSLFSEAGQEIQGILLNGFISCSDEVPYYVPVASSTPISPPSRSHNPMVQDSSFSHGNEGGNIPESGDLGLFSVSPPSKGIYGTF